MIKFAITGGIGSGKSFVSHLLGLMNIPIYCADIEAKQLMISDDIIRQSLVALLGEEVYIDGNLNKPFLANYLFSDAQHVQQVNAIVHPRVRAHFSEWVEKNKHLLLVGIESAILYESGFQDLVDVVVLVYAPLSLRIARTMKRDGMTDKQVMDRVAVQMNEEEKRKKADIVVLNDEQGSLLSQLEQLVRILKTRK